MRLRLRRVRLCLRLCRGRGVTAADLPSPEALEAQAARLAGMRSRLLRQAGVAHLGPVLDLGAGYGAVTGELRRRAKGPVVALDRRREALAHAGPPAVAADAHALPFSRGAFAAVFCQLVFLWLADLPRALAEIDRVLAPGGTLLAIEPDYGGLVEHPADLALGEVWRAAIARAGGDPLAGRHLVARLGEAGYHAETRLLPSLAAPDGTRFDVLAGLPLEPAERARVDAARRAEQALPPGAAVIHLPFFFVLARRR